jgi:TFIIF-interacting CTD phosphatase-like protein
MPKFRDYDIRLDLPEYKTFCYIYLRDYFDEFMNYIDENFEPILYTTGEKQYVDKIMKEIDPNNVFKYRLYQEDCHLYKNHEDNVVEYLKDINLFTNRSLKRKILLEHSPLNFVLSPDNIYQIDKFHPDDYGREEKDGTFSTLIHILDSIKNDEDVRNYLINNFNLRQMAINSKLL